MNRRIPLLATIHPLLLVSLVFFTGCGGGGGGGLGGGGPVIPPSLTATFAADNPNPQAATLSMAPGASSGNAFELEIMVTGIDDFYGTGFHVYFDDASASFSGLITPAPPTSAAESFLFGFGLPAPLEFGALQIAPGVIAVNATRKGLVDGVPFSLTPQLLLKLGFTATTNSTGNTFSFDSPAPAAAADFREVQICATVASNDECVTAVEAGLTWSGGVMTTN